MMHIICVCYLFNAPFTTDDRVKLSGYIILVIPQQDLNKYKLLGLLYFTRPCSPFSLNSLSLQEPGCLLRGAFGTNATGADPRTPEELPSSAHDTARNLQNPWESG